LWGAGKTVRQTKRRLAFVGPFLCFVSLGKQRNEEKKILYFFLQTNKSFALVGVITNK
jgi:hypothetical protein